MKIKRYDANDLLKELKEYEEVYGVSSEVFYEGFKHCKFCVDIDAFEAHYWVSIFVDWKRLRSDS